MFGAGNRTRTDDLRLQLRAVKTNNNMDEMNNTLLYTVSNKLNVTIKEAPYGALISLIIALYFFTLSGFVFVAHA